MQHIQLNRHFNVFINVTHSLTFLGWFISDDIFGNVLHLRGNQLQNNRGRCPVVIYLTFLTRQSI